MKLLFQYILIALIIFGCETRKDNYAYIGGEIINPSTNFVVISKSDSILESIKLDGNNRFLFKIDNLESGIYTFRHGGEIQMVLLEPKDSIMFRLNTLDFDESLVFTGEGDKKNNYLINDFLQNEIEQKEVFKFCQLDPVAYQHQIDSIKAGKNLNLKTFQKKNKTSKLFNTIAQANIDYSYYTSKEIYPFIHYGDKKRDIIKSLPKDFYKYRKTIDYNSDFNNEYYNYNSFLRSTFNNLALSGHFGHSKSDHVTTNSLCYNLDILHVVDSVITNPILKNEMLLKYTMGYLSQSNNSKENNDILESFLSKNTSTKNKNTVSSFVSSLNTLKTGNNFPNIKLINLNKTEVEMNTLVKKPTVVYFWSNSFYDHFKDSHFKVREFMTKYPEVGFIAINIDDEYTDLCIESMKKNKFAPENEFKFKNPKESKLELAIYPMTKTILLDKENKIVNSNTNIFAANFEEQLLGLINR